MKSACLLAVLLCANLDCRAAPEAKGVDGNQLLRHCNMAIQFMDSGHFTDELQSGEGSFCFGFAVALIQSVNVSLQMDEIAGHKDMRKYYPCFPRETGMTSEQAIRIIVKFLKANPERLHEDAILLCFDALTHAFPCKAT